jgi:hypothetical protein
MKTLIALLSLTVAFAAPVAPVMAEGGILVGPDFPSDHPRGEPGRDPRGGGYSTYECKNDMGHLRRVYEEDLDIVTNPNEVSVIPVCGGEYGLMRADGNAGALRQHIATNEAIMDALGDANYFSDDVVGVRMTGDESVIIYVHNFLYR